VPSDDTRYLSGKFLTRQAVGFATGSPAAAGISDSAERSIVTAV
jgi:hypothetical protein